MPTYAYACQSCGHSFEVRQSFSDDALTVCPECSGALRKLFNNVGIVFKGSGFYRNDSRSSNGSSGNSSSTSDKGSEKASESKPAASDAKPSSSSSSTSSSSSSSSSSTGGATSAA